MDDADEIQDNGPRFIPSDICVTSIEGNYMLIKVEELFQQSHEWPSFKVLTFKFKMLDNFILSS